MSFQFNEAMTNPTLDRSEWRLYLLHPAIGDGTKYHYIGDNIETMSYAVNVETTEKATIAQKLPIISNSDGGITFPAEFQLVKGNAAYDAIMASGLLGKVNEEFGGLMVYGNLEVLEGGTPIPDAAFAQQATLKFTISGLGGAGTELITITTEGRTSGDIKRGYVTLETGGVLNYDPDEETWVKNSFTEVVTFGIGDIRVRQ